MYLKQILNEAKERAIRAAVLQATAGLEMTSKISEAKKDDQHPLKRVKGLTLHTWQDWTCQGSTTACGPGTWVWVRGKTQSREHNFKPLLIHNKPIQLESHY